VTPRQIEEAEAGLPVEELVESAAKAAEVEEFKFPLIHSDVGSVRL